MDYYNPTTNTFYRGGAFHSPDGTIFNPTEETIAKYGYLPYTPPPPPTPTPPTEEELSVARRLAYEGEADRYLIAYQGYLVEGKTEEAENCRMAYLAKKAEIRKRFS